MSKIKVPSIFKTREFVIALLLVVASLIISLFAPTFLSWLNIKSVILAVSVNGIIAVGMVLLLAVGEMDLSVGMAMAFTGVICAKLMKADVPMVLAILIALVISAVIGLLNGFMVAKIGLNSFIVTLGMSSCLQGLMLVISNGSSVSSLPDSFKNIGQGTFLDLQYPVYVLIVIVVAADLLFRNNRGMRQIYYVGSNEKAAKLNGIKISKVKVSTFIAASVLSGLVGIMFAARLGSASVTIGGSTAMDTITACIIGGASLKGGRGTVLGAVLGALFLSILSTALNLLNVNVYWQNFITGAILILAIMIDAFTEYRRSHNKKII